MQNKKPRVVFDLMGGDGDPSQPCASLVQVAKEHPNVEFIAVGSQAVFEKHLSVHHPNISLQVSTEDLPMGVDPSRVMRIGEKSSMGKAVLMLKNKLADAFLTAGDTGALMTLGYFHLKMAPEMRRPAILSAFEFRDKKTWILDLGANIQSTGVDLYNNARFASKAVQVNNPGIVLLNVGLEENKGPVNISEAHQLLKNDPDLNYQGFIEGNHVISTPADIIVCDGFVGNCLTKLLESMIDKSISHNKSMQQFMPRLTKCAMLLGLNGHLYKCHGNSNHFDFYIALKEVIHSLTKSLHLSLQE